MNKKAFKRVALSFICALALVSIPMSHSWAQSTQQDQSDQQHQYNQDSQQQDLNSNQDQNLNQPNSDQNMDQREKPSPSMNDQDSTQKQYQDQDQNKSQSTTEPQPTGKEQTTPSTTQEKPSQTGGSKEGMPATAGELPLIALIGCLSLAAALSTRFFPAKSGRRS